MINYRFIAFFLFSAIFMGYGQTKDPSEKVVITSEKKKTKVYLDNDGVLQVNVSPSKVRSFKSKGHVRYSDFGAKGNAKTDDMNAIAVTHAFANIYGLNVKADAGASYYIGGM